MSDIAGWGDLAGSQRSGSDAGGPRTGREALEGGEEGSADGQPEGARLGQEWKSMLIYIC